MSELDEILNDLISIVPMAFDNKMDLVRIKELAIKDITALISTEVAKAKSEGFDMALGIWEKTMDATPEELKIMIAEGKKFLAEVGSNG